MHNVTAFIIFKVMANMMTDEFEKSSIRISWGPDTDVDVFKKEFENLLKVANSLIE